jgi:hypothetical protein
MLRILLFLISIIFLTACSASDEGTHLPAEPVDGFDSVSKEEISEEAYPFEADGADNPFASITPETEASSGESVYTYHPSADEADIGVPEEPRLRGIMEDSAVIEYMGKSYLLSRGQKFGIYKVESIGTGRAVLSSSTGKLVLRVESKPL